MRPVRPQLQAMLPSLALALAACTGTVGGGKTPGAGGGPGSGGAGVVTGTAGSNGAGTAGSSGGSDALAACPSTEVTPTPLRRLTRFEYANTTRNLLGVNSTAAN